MRLKDSRKPCEPTWFKLVIIKNLIVSQGQILNRWKVASPYGVGFVIYECIWQFS